jgi:hypothetical protein
MKVGNHLANTFNAARHGAHHVQLIAVIDTHVGVGGPNEYGVNAPIALIEIVEVAVDSISMSYGIVEIAIVHHHLRLNEA